MRFKYDSLPQKYPISVCHTKAFGISGHHEIQVKILQRNYPVSSKQSIKAAVITLLHAIFHGFFSCLLRRTFWIRETGIFAKHSKHWLIDRIPTCVSSSLFYSVGFDYLAGTFTILFLFYLIATLFMICENVYFYHDKIGKSTKKCRSMRTVIRRRMHNGR